MIHAVSSLDSIGEALIGNADAVRHTISTIEIKAAYLVFAILSPREKGYIGPLPADNRFYILILPIAPTTITTSIMDIMAGKNSMTVSTMVGSAIFSSPSDFDFPDQAYDHYDHHNSYNSRHEVKDGVNDGWFGHIINLMLISY